MEHEIIETTEDGRFRVRLEIHQSAENPRRDYDHNTHVITMKNSRYIDVDTDGGPLQSGWDRVADRDGAVKIFTRWARVFHGSTAIEDNPVEGARSLWYMTPEQIKDVGNTPEEVIRSEINEYRSWAKGEVYGYIIERAVDWDSRDSDESTSTWEEVESCWGLIGSEWAEQAARDAFASYETEGAKA